MYHPSSLDSLITTLQNLQKEFSVLEKEHSILLHFFKEEKDLTSFQRQEIESLKTYKRSLLEVNRRLLEENNQLKETAKKEEGRREREKQIKIERVKQKKNQSMFLLKKLNSILDEYQKFFDQAEGSHFDLKKMTLYLKNDLGLTQFSSSEFPRKTSSILLTSLPPPTLPPSFSIPPSTITPNHLTSPSPPFPPSTLTKVKREESIVEHPSTKQESGRKEEVHKIKTDKDCLRRDMSQNELKEVSNKKEDTKVMKEQEDGRKEEEDRRREEDGCRREERGKEDSYLKLANLASQVFSKESALSRNLQILIRLSINSYFWSEIQRKNKEIQAESAKIFEQESFLEGSLLKILDESWTRMGNHDKRRRSQFEGRQREEESPGRDEKGGNIEADGDNKSK